VPEWDVDAGVQRSPRTVRGQRRVQHRAGGRHRHHLDRERFYRVRFDKDTMEFEQFMKDFWLLKKCDLRGVI
jgi:hypothetical protein